MRRNSNSTIPKPVKSSSPINNLNVNRNMATSKITTPQPAMTEIKQSTLKRVSLKISPKLPKLSRSTSSPTPQITSSRYSLTATRRSSLLSSSVNSVDNSDINRPSIQLIQEEGLLQENKSSNKENFTEENNHNNSKTSTNNDNKDEIKLIQTEESTVTAGDDNQEAPVLMRKLTKAMSSSTTKTQKTNVTAAESVKSLPRSLMRSLLGGGGTSKKEDNQTPIYTLITTPSLSPPTVSQFYTSSTIVSERKKKNRRSRSGSLSLTAQALSNMLKRRSKNRSSSYDSSLNEVNGAPVLTYESFPDPDPDDFFNVYSWDIPDSIVSIEDAGGVLQMIEYDGIFINGVKVD